MLELEAGQIIYFTRNRNNGKRFRIIARGVKNFYPDGGSIVVYDIDYETSSSTSSSISWESSDTVMTFDEALDIVEKG